MSIPPIQIPSDLSQLATPQDVQRFASAWVAQMTTLFNQKIFPMLNAASVVKGRISGAGAILSGEGFTVVRSSTGRFRVTFLTPFATVPAVVAMATDNCNYDAATISESLVDILVDHLSTLVDPTEFSFIAIGQAA